MQWKTAWISTLLFTLRSKQWYSAKEYCTVMTLKGWFILLSHTHSTFYTQHPIINTETQHFTVATSKSWLIFFPHTHSTFYTQHPIINTVTQHFTVATSKSWLVFFPHTHSTFYTQHPIINTETQHFTVATFKIWPTCFSHVKKNPLCWQCKMLSRDFDRVSFLQIVTVQSSGKQSFSLQCRVNFFKI